MRSIENRINMERTSSDGNVKKKRNVDVVNDELKKFDRHEVDETIECKVITVYNNVLMY